MTHTPFDSASTVYNVGDFIPQTWRGWDDYSARLARYEILEGYYHNLAYHKIMQYAQSLKVEEQLYKHVRGVKNSGKRLVETHVSKVYGGALDTQKGEAGAIPLDTKDERLRQAIIQGWRDSQWGQKKSLYVRYGAQKGDSFIKIVDDIQKRQVRMEVVDPAKVKKIIKEADGTIIYAEFEYYIRDMDSGFNRLYREVIDVEKFQIFTRETINLYGKAMPQIVPFALYTNGRNEAVSEWPNPYGFVPLVHVQHTDMGLCYGASVMHGLLQKINELNDLHSIINDAMRNQAQLPLVTINAKIETLDFGTDRSTSSDSTIDTPKKDTMKVLNLTGTDVDLKTLAPTLDIGASMLNVENIEAEIEKDSPELALHRLRDSGNLTAPGVRSAYDDAIGKIQESRGNYDTGTVKAQQMLVAIGGMRGYDGYQGYNLLSLENGALDHQIKARPVISDSLSLSEKLDKTFMAMDKSAPQTVYIEMGWSKEQADEIIASAQANQDRFAMQSAFGNKNTLQPPDDPEASPQDAFDARQNGAVNAADLMAADKMLMSA